ncbi:MAG: energy transducer TonB, partial [Pseudanabaenaceae cyanobacterium]
MTWGGGEDWAGRTTEERSLRRLWLYGGAASLVLHGWLLGQSWSLRLPVARVEPEPPLALELVTVEPVEPPVETPPEPLAETPLAEAPSAPPVVAAVPTAAALPPPPVPSPQPRPVLEPRPAAPPPMAKPQPEPSLPAPATPNLDPPLPAPPAASPLAPTPSSEGWPMLPPFIPTPAEGTGAATDRPANPPALTGSSEDFAERVRRLLGSRTPAPATPPPQAAAPPAASPSGGASTCLRCDRPGYPAGARARNLQGQVRLAVDVAPDGTVTAVRLVQSSGHGELDDAALRHAWSWQFSRSTNGRTNFRAS